MKRFVLPSADLGGPEIIITGEAFHHIINVIRLKEGMKVVIADGHGSERPAVLGPVGIGKVSLRFFGEKTNIPRKLPAVTIYQGLPKGDKIDLIIQKCTELGAASIVPFVAERSIRKIPEERFPEITRRWQRIAEEAARQSGSIVPRIRLAGNLRDALDGDDDQLKLLLWEEEKVWSLRAELERPSAPDRVAVIIGPEGGITATEAEEAAACGFLPATLGSNILRTETASLVVLSLMLYRWGELGGPQLQP